MPVSVKRQATTAMQNRSIIWGLVLAALAPGACTLSYALLLGGKGDGIASLLSGALLALAISLVFSAVPILLLGAPYILWLRSRNALTWINVCLGSTIAGALTLAGLIWTMTFENRVPDAGTYLLGAGLGFASGIAFWFGANAAYAPQRTPDGAAE